MSTAHECVNDCGSVVECEIPCSQRGEHFCENCQQNEAPILRNKPPLEPAEAVYEIADFIYEASKEWGLPCVLSVEERKVIEGIVRRVRN